MKAEALVTVDLVFARRLSPSPHAAAYAEKADHARRFVSGGEHSDHIAAEAEVRGVTPASLAFAIIARQHEASVAALALDLERQKVKARVRGAVDQHAVMAILIELEEPR